MSKVKPTKHAVSRLKSRGVTRSANGARQATINAYNIGLDYTDAEGEVKKYIDYLYERKRADGAKRPKIRIYGEHVYIFDGRTLITAYKVPEDYREEALVQYRNKKEAIMQAKADEEQKRMERASKLNCFSDRFMMESYLPSGR